MIRVWVERSTGLAIHNGRKFPGIAHEFVDVTDKPHPTIDARPRTAFIIEHHPDPPVISYASDNPNGFKTGIQFSVDKPALTVMAAGMAGDSLGHWHLHNDGRAEGTPPVIDKPPYAVPLMQEIAAIPWNGFTAISTFSGCGGSSLGYRMAGFRVLWASEFIEAARDSYHANKAAHTILDARDIRKVTPEDILTATGLKVGDLDLLDGSPPCASFSSAGRRHEGWGKQRTYSDGEQRSDDLFFEFARILKGLQPKTFIAENVSGLIKGTAKGYFLEILAALKACGYRVEAKLLDAQWLGVPQARQRLIFQGVRLDLALAPAYPLPLAYRYTVRDALPHISIPGSAFEPRMIIGNDAFESVWGVADRPSPTICVCETRTSGKIEVEVLDAAAGIGQYQIGKEWDKLNPGQNSDKYFQLKKADPDHPSPTIIGHGAAKGLATVVHPTEKRKFTIAELRRICAFPDDFVLTGNYSQQWERLGRAVPPVMMAAIATAVRDRVLIPARLASVPVPPIKPGKRASVPSGKSRREKHG
jgi:DNA (cytosine-5)-methyltransferase 1